MKNNYSLISWFIGIVVFGVMIFVYYSYFPNGFGSSSYLEETNTDQVGGQVLSLLNQVEQIDIHADFFENPNFKALVDYTVPIPEEKVGRPNPFAPIPGVAAPGSTKNGK